ncbi:HU family DNA-binding protein [Fodinibius sp. Rm-B-1B1-1]|uniref:HU family DNA-binding protein n=1 Tax=Fodinibius alkaliphilus TaxID=3140241 RepID=UPI00315B189D
MSEKITFGELIESIAAETDHSKQLTHDFLKDFVNIINGGLEEDGKVNIAGFGKFELKHVDEREGYNPQTEEKMTIPAHNKIVFKPYKDLRELVNAPYAHMEPKLLEATPAESGEPTNSDSKSEVNETKNVENPSTSADANDDGSDDCTSREGKLREDDFIPTGPPTSHDEEVLESAPDNTKGDTNDNPFNFAEDDSTKSPEVKNESDDDNGDIVEFDGDSSDEEDSDEEILEQFIGTEEEITPEDVDSQVDLTPKSEEYEEIPSADSNEEILAEEVEKLEKTAEELKQQSDQAKDDQEPKEEEKQDVEALPMLEMQRSDNRTSAVPYVAAAVILLLLVVGGTWYYSNMSDSNMPLISSEQTTASADVTSSQAADDRQEEISNEETDEAQQSEAANQSTSNNSNPSNNTQSTQQAAQPVSTTTQNETSVEIEEGQTLWSMAEERYGNPRLWPWIYGHDGSLDDPDVIYAGSSLSVPLPSGPQNTLNATDSVGVAKGFLATYKWYKSNETAVAKNHLWAAKRYHKNLQQIADISIDKADLSFANSAR